MNTHEKNRCPVHLHRQHLPFAHGPCIAHAQGPHRRRGNPPDPRSVAEARRRGIEMPAHRARQVRAADFEGFDWIVGMTEHHCAALRRLAPAGTAHKVHLFTEFAEGIEGDVPDPWYGGQRAFVEVFDLIDLGVDGLLPRLAAPATSARARPATR
jgi:protein-tyrosine phosphatase